MTRMQTNGRSTNGHGSGGISALTPEERFLRYKKELHQQLITGMDLAAIGTMDEQELRVEVRRAAEVLSRQGADLLNLSERERLVTEVLDETFGLGPLEPLMRDPTITDIMINGPKVAYVERKGRLERVDIGFHDDRHLVQIIQRIAGRIGRRVDETSPMVDARLADGSRVNAVIAPLALDGALLSIRRFGKKPLLANDLVGFRAITQEMIDFLSACIKARINLVISGGTGSGKTTLLNALSSFIPEDERVATIEDAAELRLQQPHVVRMETRAANIEGSGEITTRDLVKNALRMRPDRIIIGECRGAETLDMIQAMNTGHEGSMTTVHANTPRDALSRLETMISMAGLELPIRALRSQFASAVDLIIQASRLQGGPRKVTSISEVIGMEGDTIIMQEIFNFTQLGIDANGRAFGEFRATGVRPSFMERLEQNGCHLNPDMFRQRVLLKD